MNLKSVVVIMDNDNPSNPPLVILQDTLGDTVQSVTSIKLIDDLIENGWLIFGVGNFQLGNGVYQNILLQPATYILLQPATF